MKHLINVKTVAERRENMLWFRAPEKVYFKKGSTPVALDELGTVMGKKRAFIVTDQFLFKNGNTRAIEPSSTRWASPTTASTTSSPIRRCSAHVAAPSRWLSLSRTSSSPSAVAPLWTPARSCG